MTVFENVSDNLAQFEAKFGVFSASLAKAAQLLFCSDPVRQREREMKDDEKFFFRPGYNSTT